MKSYRKSLWGILLLVPLLWWAWPSSKTTTAGDDLPPAESPSTVHTPASDNPTGNGGPSRTRAARQQQAPKILTPPSSPEVDHILVDESISTAQAAEQLCAIAMDTNHTTAHRLEALQHGLNLGIESFAGFAEQPDLPAELASCFLDEVINYNDSPATQIRSYIALIKHPDEEVSALAKEMLAFLVEDDNQEASNEKLIQMGREKIQALTTPPAQD